MCPAGAGCVSIIMRQQANQSLLYPRRKCGLPEVSPATCERRCPSSLGRRKIHSPGLRPGRLLLLTQNFFLTKMKSEQIISCSNSIRKAFVSKKQIFMFLSAKNVLVEINFRNPFLQLSTHTSTFSARTVERDHLVLPVIS